MTQAEQVEVERWSWWLSAMAGVRRPTSEGLPETGFYNWNRQAVKIWFVGTELRALVDGKPQGERYIRDNWVWISKNPVSEEAYKEFRATGKWPGENAVVLGHNNAPRDDSIEAAIERLNDLAREAENMIAGGEAKTEAAWDQASDLANKLGEWEQKISGLHKVEKEPHLEAGRRVDRKWFPLRDRAKELKERLRLLVVTPFSIKRKAAATAAAVNAIAAGASSDQTPVIRTAAGQTMRRTPLRTYYRAQIEDMAALREHLKDHPRILACLQDIADDAAKKKIALPGCKVIADQRAA